MNTINNLIKDTVEILDSVHDGYGAGIVAFNYGYLIDDAMSLGIIQRENRGGYAERYCISAKGLERASKLGYLHEYEEIAQQISYGHKTFYRGLLTQAQRDYAANTLLATYWYHEAGKAKDAGKTAKFRALYERGVMYDKIAHSYDGSFNGMMLYDHQYKAWCDGGKQASHIRMRFEMMTGRNFQTGEMR